MIRWTYKYSGWTYLFFLFNEVIINIHFYTSDAGEDGLQVVKSIVQLIERLLKHNPEKMEEFEPLIVGVLKLTKRFILICF